MMPPTPNISICHVINISERITTFLIIFLLIIFNHKFEEKTCPNLWGSGEHFEDGHLACSKGPPPNISVRHMINISDRKAILFSYIR